MCGICGYMEQRVIPLENLRAMNDTMIKRGPNDSGAEVFEGPAGYTIGMAQRRLSILDLSPLGHQPMHSPDGRVSLVYNGEIYNYQEIKKELPEYPFRSNCDTEVIIAAYLKWGIRKAVEKFNGMFAFALYDRQTEKFYLVRDRMGVKPLYYWDDRSSQGIVFASELKPILACPGFSESIRREVLPRFLYHQYINAIDTIFTNVYKLEPGCILTVETTEHRTKFTQERYWTVADVYHEMQKNPVTDYQEAKAQLKALLQKATAYRMISDVPLGAFLSGGYDSSLVSALAQEHLGSTPLHTFSIGFSEKEYNEAEYAKKVADHLGCDHTELYIGEKDMFDLVESLPQYFDEPMADSSQIPTMLVSKLAREHVTVALSGDAGDEFFCGYSIYDYVARAQRFDTLGSLAHLVGQIPLGETRLEDHYPFKVQVISKNRIPEIQTQFAGSSYVSAARKMVIDGERRSIPVLYPQETGYGVSNWQIRRMLLDMDTYLPGDILAKVDRASMKYSLECRCPILDRDVMEYSFRIDHSFKYHNGIKKYILKDIAYDYIPKDLLDRPKKGFSVPLSKWLRGPLKEQLLSYADPAYLRKQGLFDPEYTQDLVRAFMDTGDAGPATGRNYSKLCWSFFVFQQWYEHYLGR